MKDGPERRAKHEDIHQWSTDTCTIPTQFWVGAYRWALLNWFPHGYHRFFVSRRQRLCKIPIRVIFLFRDSTVFDLMFSFLDSLNCLCWFIRCEHYKRRCKIRAPCCNLIFPCRHCHNEAAVRLVLSFIMGFWGLFSAKVAFFLMFLDEKVDFFFLFQNSLTDPKERHDLVRQNVKQVWLKPRSCVWNHLKEVALIFPA